VFFVPSSPETWDADELPHHPALRLASVCEQPLSGRYSRRLVTFVKAARYDAAAAAAWRASRAGWAMGIERVADLVWETRPERAARAAAAAEAAGAGAGAGAPAPVPRRVRDGGGGEGGGGGNGGSGGLAEDSAAPASAPAREPARELASARR
jgi:hypothetical protein